MTKIKVGIISQARMTSTRLPGKVLKKINNKPLLWYHINRLQKSGLPIFVATTTNREDDPIVEFCLQNNLNFFRGDEANVLERFYLCAKEYDLDVIVRVTSDCPLIDGALIEEGVDRYTSRKNLDLYLSNSLSETYPRGLDFEIFSFKLLEEALKNATYSWQKEHVTPYFYNEHKAHISNEFIANKEKKNQYRITVDTTEDFQLIERLIKEFNAHKKSYSEIIQIMDVNSDLANINRHIEQKKLKE